MNAAGHYAAAELWAVRAEALFDQDDYEALQAARAAAAIASAHAATAAAGPPKVSRFDLGLFVGTAAILAALLVLIWTVTG